MRHGVLAACAVGALFAGWLLGHLGGAEPKREDGVNRTQAVPEDLTLLRREVASLRGDLDVRISGLERYVSDLDARMRSTEGASVGDEARLPFGPEPGQLSSLRVPSLCRWHGPTDREEREGNRQVPSSLPGSCCRSRR